MPVDLLINFAQDYASKKYDRGFIKKIFSVNRAVRIADLENLSGTYSEEGPQVLFAAEEQERFES